MVSVATPLEASRDARRSFSRKRSIFPNYSWGDIRLETLHRHYQELARMARHEVDIRSSHSVEEAAARHAHKRRVTIGCRSGTDAGTAGFVTVGNMRETNAIEEA